MARRRTRKRRKRKMRIGECRRVKGNPGIKLCMTRRGPRFRRA